MKTITIKEWQGIMPGQTVSTGYAHPSTLTAPTDGECTYTLYELASDSNTHVGWRWEKEGQA